MSANESTDSPLSVSAQVATLEPDTPPDPSSVSILLRDSRAAHLRMQIEKRDKRPDAAMTELAQAFGLRKAAAALDPEFSDPAWATDRAFQFEHVKVLAFYEQQTTRRG